MAQGEGSGDFVAGFLFGAFVGAVLALLFAPAPGEEIREQIRERGIELKDRAEELGAEATKQAGVLRTKGQTLLDEQKTRLHEAIEEGKKAAARKKEELLSQLEQAKSAGEEDLAIKGGS
ncbi:MAG: YtxH domain-containing protein [Chloroflexota bacterium]